MWKLPLPDYSNSLSHLITALTYKSGEAKHELTLDEQKLITDLYQKYERLKGKASDTLKGLSLSNVTKQAIQDGYNEVQEAGRLSELRSDLMLAAKRCPFCGIGAVTDLDHHLPQSLYQPLSIYSSNLVPLCHKCNNKKRAITNTDPDKSFIHVYYDDIPENEAFLCATTKVSDKGLHVEFTINSVSGLSNELFKKLKFQFKRVNANKRLQSEINIFLCSFAVNIEEAFVGNDPAEAVKSLLWKQFLHFERRFGLNDWRSSLLYSLAMNDDFCNGGFKKSLGLE